MRTAYPTTLFLPRLYLTSALTRFTSTNLVWFLTLRVVRGEVLVVMLPRLGGSVVAAGIGPRRMGRDRVGWPSVRGSYGAVFTLVHILLDGSIQCSVVTNVGGVRFLFSVTIHLRYAVRRFLFSLSTTSLSSSSSSTVHSLISNSHLLHLQYHLNSCPHACLIGHHYVISNSNLRILCIPRIA